MALLVETVLEAHCELAADIRRESEGKPSRRLEALRIACYNVEKLEAHLSASRRLLNDLRSIRRLLFDERGVARPKIAATVASPASLDERKIERRPVSGGVAALAPMAARPAQPKSRTAAAD